MFQEKKEDAVYEEPEDNHIYEVSVLVHLLSLLLSLCWFTVG